jgi:hypothetical protein
VSDDEFYSDVSIFEYDDAIEYLAKADDVCGPEVEDPTVMTNIVRAMMIVKATAKATGDDEAQVNYFKYRRRFLDGVTLPDPDDPDFTVPDFPPEV